MTHEGVEATLQHVRLLDRRRRRLATAQTEAEDQLFHRVGTLHRRGELSFIDLLAIHARCQEIKTPGITTRWDTHIEIPWRRLVHAARHLPNGPAGTWIGIAPLPGDHTAPSEGLPVVYVLFSDDNDPCYVGSTAKFRERLKAHLRDGKPAVRWQAYACTSREDAYVLEERLLAERMPRLNRKATR